MKSPSECDVLVVGLGPVGAVLAALLGQYGLDVIAIEPQKDVYPLPRAAHADHEIVRIFQDMGVVDAIMPHLRVAPNYEFRAVNGEALMRIERDGLLGVSGWPTSFNLYQPGIEIAVRDLLASMPNVTTWFGAKFVDLTSHSPDRVVAAVEADGEIHQVAAKYLVGCDGAWSPVREACGIGLSDYGFDEPWLVLDAIVPDETHFPALNLQLCNPERPTTFVHMGPGRLRWEFMLRPDEDPQVMRQPENVDMLLAPWRAMGEIIVERSATYNFHGLVADRWRDGRVFLAGDSAHQMPPFLGQGLCSGLRDAANLAWKIDYALRSGSDELLDSYQVEREPHVRYVIELAIEMGRVVCTLDPDLAAKRDAEMLAGSPVRGPIVLPDITGLTWDGSPKAGALFRQSVDAREGKLDDILGRGAWLIHRAPTAPTLPCGGKTFALRDLPPALAAQVDAWLDGLGAQAVLVRPDRYVFGTGKVADLVDAWASRVGAVEVAA